MKLLRLIWDAEVKPPAKIKEPPRPAYDLVGWSIHGEWIDLVVSDDEGSNIAVRGEWYACTKQANRWRFWPTGKSVGPDMFRELDDIAAAIVWGVHDDKRQVFK